VHNVACKRCLLRQALQCSAGIQTMHVETGLGALLQRRYIVQEEGAHPA